MSGTVLRSGLDRLDAAAPVLEKLLIFESMNKIVFVSFVIAVVVVSAQSL